MNPRPTTMDSPIGKLKHWFQEAITDSPLRQKSAVCVSTIDEAGLPSARFVDLKAVDETGLVFCTYLDSAKGRHLMRNPHAAITAWWDHLGYQVRVVGSVAPISEQEAMAFWKSRSRSAQLTTATFEQSQPLASEEDMEKRVRAHELELQGLNIAKPPNWGGFRVSPSSVEFLLFRESRLHLRELYTLENGRWVKGLLQP